MARVRHPAVAGLFYPDLPGVLDQTVENLLNEASPPSPRGTIVALISPHAGYVYSGSTAARGYVLLRNTAYESVVIVGPSHREYFDGISVYPGDAYLTPLGVVSIDAKLRNDLLRAEPRLRLSEAGHRSEHALEVQLPFLQKVLGEFKFLPIVMGDQRRELCEMLAAALSSALEGSNALLIASSDLSHYHPHDIAVSLDRRVIQSVEAFDPLRLLEALERQEVEACGGGPMVAVMEAARSLGATTTTILGYCTSGDITGERDAVVGYLSAALTSEVHTPTTGGLDSKNRARAN